MPVGGFYITDPTWREQPELVIAQVKEQMAVPHAAAEGAAFQERRRARIAELRAALHDADRVEFDHWLSLVEQAYPLNEAHNYLLFDQPMGLIRYAVLEAGRRLAAAGRLAATGDVFFLTREELTGVLRDPRDIQDTVAQRRAEHARNAALAAPPVIGGPPSPPPVQVFPLAVATAMSAILRQAAAYFGVAPAPSAAGQIRGTPGGPGVGEGPARIVRGPDDFGKVQPGDVLVCPLTNAAWCVLFPRLAGLVTDSGGALSHPAIVAREYGLPSVVGTLHATQRIRDGQRVRVDGAAGVVHLLG
jgi:pyruvate,water dikinase